MTEPRPLIEICDEYARLVKKLRDQLDDLLLDARTKDEFMVSQQTRIQTLIRAGDLLAEFAPGDLAHEWEKVRKMP